MQEMTIEATLDNLGIIQGFIEEKLEEAECPMGILMQVSIAVEEIYVNIARYAYNPEVGYATIRCAIGANDQGKTEVSLGFVDQGKPFNPLAKEDADITLSAEERDIGGLGILMVKKSMDNVEYHYEDGQNILTITKSF